MTNTEYTVNGQMVTYEVLEDGYNIYLDEKLWISQQEPYIPYPDLGYEESCLKQIEELCTKAEPEQTETEQRLSALEEENTMLFATLDDILMNVIPSMIEESEVN